MAKTPPKRLFLSHSFCAAMMGQTRALCAKVGLNMGTLENWKMGYGKVSVTDERLQKIADILKFPKDKMFDNYK